MSGEAYDDTPGLPPQPRRTIDDLIDSMERATGALTQSATSPDEQQEFERFELISTGPMAIDTTISFIAREVRVDNFTNMHMEVTNSLVGQLWVPPGAVGFRIPLSGTRHLKIQQAAPPGITDPTWTAGTIAVFIFSKFPTHSVVIGDTLVASGSTPPAVQVTGDAGKSQTQAYSADGLSTALLGLIVNARLQGFNGSGVDRFRIPNVFKQVAVAMGASSINVVWTPASGKKPRLMGWVVSGSSALVDASVSFFETNSSGTFMGETGFLAGIQTPSYVSFGPGGPIVSVSSAVIVAWSSTAMTLRGTLFGVEE